MLRYTSEAQFASDIASGVIPNSIWPNGSYVLYDNEGLDLGNTDATCPRSTHGGTNLSWYEQCHIARYAVEDGGGGVQVVVQTQSETLTEVDFHTLYTGASLWASSCRTPTPTRPHPAAGRTAS